MCRFVAVCKRKSLKLLAQSSTYGRAGPRSRPGPDPRPFGPLTRGPERTSPSTSAIPNSRASRFARPSALARRRTSRLESRVHVVEGWDMKLRTTLDFASGDVLGPIMGAMSRIQPPTKAPVKQCGHGRCLAIGPGFLRIRAPFLRRISRDRGPTTLRGPWSSPFPSGPLA